MEDDTADSLENGGGIVAGETTTFTSGQTKPPPADPRWFSGPKQCVAIIAIVLMLASGIIFIFSYRTDITKYYRDRMGAVYTDEQPPLTEGLWWVHRITAILWTFAICVQISYVIIYKNVFKDDRKKLLIHKSIGAVAVASNFVNIASGLWMLFSDLFDDDYTTAFVLINASVNVILIPSFLISRFALRGKFHSYLGFAFCLGVCGALYQFFIFSFAVMPGLGDARLKWRLSMGAALILSVVTYLAVLAIYHKTTRFGVPPRNHEN